MLFNLYIGNHRSRDGIEDYISVLDMVLKRHGHQLRVTSSLGPAAINIIIDEFTSAVTNEEIKEFKRECPHSALVFVLTEFVVRRVLVRSFNLFGGVHEVGAVAALRVYLKVRRPDFGKVTLPELVVAGLYAPVLGVFYAWHLCRNLRRGKRSFRSRLDGLPYMTMRYLGFEAMIPYADGLILSHPLIERGLRASGVAVPVLGTLYPELDFGAIRQKLFKNKRLHIEITGSITRHRQGWIERINRDITWAAPQFGLCRAVPFNSAESEADGSGRASERGAYSLHPPQAKRWPYVSPMRIYRALDRDGTIPVLTRLFGQHPIEQLCLVYRGLRTLAELSRFYRHREALEAWLKPRVEEYLHAARAANDRLIGAMVALEATKRGRSWPEQAASGVPGPS